MTLRFSVDRCTAAEVVGWIDDEGPVRSIDIELNGEWLGSVSPSIYRPDLEAAGYGDGKRGFAVSMIRHLRAAPLGENRVALKYDGASFYEGPIGDLVNLQESIFAQQERLSARLNQVETQIAEFRGALHFEQYRIEAALFAAEGLTQLRDEFLQARSTIEYQAVFDMDNPLVSVCVTTMNRAELLIERALASLLTQTYRNLQIIVVGDHCTDDTAERIARLGDRRIFFVNLPKRGPYPRPGIDRWRVAGSHPGNRALQLVEGEFVTHLDEDDSFEPERIQILVKKIREVRADLVFHRFWWQQPNGGWAEFGNGSFEHGQTGTSMIFYHRYLAQIPWDVFAYRFGEPEDWNRLRKFKLMRARTEFVPALLTRYYRLPVRDPFVAEPGEEFVE
jgi:Glycosyl transferase family 2